MSSIVLNQQGAQPHGSDQSDATVANASVDKDFCFDLVYFRVEDTIFSAFKKWFIVDSSPFPDMFKLPHDPQSVAEGTSADRPIVLEQTESADFKSFLSAMYSPMTPTLTSQEHWLGVLKLANRWNFVETRNQAIKALTLQMLQDPFRKIRLASQYQVRAWLKDGLVSIVDSVMSGARDVEKLAKESALDHSLSTSILLACFALMKAKSDHLKGLVGEPNCACNTSNTISIFGIPMEWRTIRNAVCSVCGRLVPGHTYVPVLPSTESLVEKYFKAELDECNYTS